jgi:hypothetical protein
MVLFRSGNSGSPVLRSADLVAIGVHCYGGAVNQASVIGLLGNVFDDYIQAVRSPISGKTTSQGIRFLAVPTATTASTIGSSGSLGTVSVPRSNPIATTNVLHSKNFAVQKFNHKHGNHTIQNSNGYNNGSNGYNNGASNDEAFMNDFGKFLARGLKIGAPMIGIAAPFCGPLGAPIGALASVALGALGKFCAESAMGAESTIDPSAPVRGLAQRAVLGEAALQAIMAMDKQMLHEEGIFDVMSAVVQKMAPVIKKAAPCIMNIIMPAALNLATTALNQAKQNPGAESVFSWPVDESILYNPSNVPVNYENSGVEAFATQLIGPMHYGEDGTEGWFGDFISSALSKTSNVLVTAAKTGLPILLDQLSKTESAMPGSPGAELPQLEGLAERAVLQEAALQAVLTLPPQKLEEEGFFSIMRSVIGKVAPVVMKAAPSIIKAVGPIISSAMRTESFTVNNLKSRNGGSTRSLKKKPSFARFESGASESDFLGSYNSWAVASGNTTIYGV